MCIRDRSIIDLTATIQPQLAIVDAVLAMEGDGPIMGRPRPVGFIGMSTDLVALDATCARVIGLAPEKMPYLSVAAEFLGNIEPGRIEHRAEAPTRYQSPFDVIEPIRKLRS